MSDEFVHIPLQDVTRRVDAPDAMREALEAAARAQGLQVAPPPTQAAAPRPTVPRIASAPKNGFWVELPPGLPVTDGMVEGTHRYLETYVKENQAEIIAAMVAGIKVEK